MGFFTYRQTKKTRKEVRALRREQAQQTATAQAAQTLRDQQAREQELFQQLPAAGKAEFRAVLEAHKAEISALPERKQTKGQDARRAALALVTAKFAIYRKYDLIP
jgi:hypothetical protein